MLIKSIFVSLYITFLHASAGYALYQLASVSFQWIWLCVLITALPGALLFDLLLLARPFARTQHHLIWLSGIKGLGLLAIVLLNILSDSINLVSMLLAGGGFFGWLAYDYWFSVFPHRSHEQIKVGQTLPELELYTRQQTLFNNNDLSGSPALLLFYRGNWCPLCMAQIKEIAASYQKLAKQGVKICLASPQPEAHTEKLAAKFNVPFIYLTDKHCRTAKRLGIFAKNGLPLGMQLFGYHSDTVLPTAILIDAEGKVIFADLTDNYRVRPEPETFLKILAQHTA